ncbi:hypothetical protein P7K49_021417, partial [Saguinus oedipus]
LRPAGPKIPAPPRPPGTRAPAPGGGQGGSGALRRNGGPSSPRVSRSAPALRCGTSPPATPQSHRRDSGGWAPWCCPSSPSAPCPGKDRAATGPAARKVLREPPPPPPLPGRGVVSLTQEEPLEQPPPF